MGYELKQLNDFQSADMCRNAIFLYVHTCLAQSTSTGSVNKPEFISAATFCAAVLPSLLQLSGL